MTDLFQEPNDATPLDPGLRDGLLQTWITSRSDLNEAEQGNIIKGAAWGHRGRDGRPVDLLHDEYVSDIAQADVRRCLEVGGHLPAE